MENVDIIYQNDMAIAFRWKRCAIEYYKKINIVFNNTALHLTEKEVVIFETYITKALSRPHSCKDCCDGIPCRSMLLETPIPQISFSMSYVELLSIQDLIKKVLFELGTDRILKKYYD